MNPDSRDPRRQYLDFNGLIARTVAVAVMLTVCVKGGLCEKYRLAKLGAFEENGADAFAFNVTH